MNESEFFILLALAKNDRHGYAILQDIEEVTGELRFGPGTIYRVLPALIDKKWIREIDPTDKITRSPRVARVYRLTYNGIKALKTELGKMSRLLAIGLERLQ